MWLMVLPQVLPEPNQVICRLVAFLTCRLCGQLLPGNLCFLALVWR